jgi:hypothetical protein
MGLFIPLAFQNITWKLFIIFGTLCFCASIQALLTYPETAGKTLEEIEMMFRKGGPRPWNTKPGGSSLDERIEDVRQQGKQHQDGILSGTETTVEYKGKNSEIV